MGLNEILLVIAALIPAIVLCVYVYKKDKVENSWLHKEGDARASDIHYAVILLRFCRNMHKADTLLLSISVPSVRHLS